jgi:hypothetical protein
MNKHVRWIALGVLLISVVGLRVWAASSTPAEMTPRASEEWSRGRIIGHTAVKRPVALRAAARGGMFLLWSNLDSRLELVHTANDGEVMLDRVLSVGLKAAHDPQLEVGADGRLHLLWREQGSSRADVRYALLETDGTVVSQPQSLSGPVGGNVEISRLVRDAKGHLHALWTDDAGVWRAVLSQAGKVLGEPTLLISEGFSPLVRVDEDGDLHIVWQQEPEINIRCIIYAALDSEKGELSDRQEITTLPLSSRLELKDVAFGLTQDRGYVLWASWDRAFDRYTFQHASFPMDAPHQRQTHTWRLKLGDGPLEISTLDGQQTPLPVALGENLMGPEGDLEHQLSLISMEAEQDQVEQVVTASPQASIRPVLIEDKHSNKHLAWLETAGFGRYRVVYASTAPGVMRKYNALTPKDALDAVLSGVFRLSTALVSVCIAFATWAVVPLVVLGGYHIVSGNETLDRGLARVALTTVLVAEVALTFAMPPRIGVDVTWAALRWVVPTATAVVTAAVTTSILRSRESNHLFGAFFLFTIINCLLQIVLYLLF